MAVQDDDNGAAIKLPDGPHRAVMQWELRDGGPLDGPAHIQVGTLAGGEWYVAHLAFGTRGFAGKQAAWDAVQRLMGAHDGRWEQIPCDLEPFLRVCPSDGSRVLLDDDSGEDLYRAWGRRKEQVMAGYRAAIKAGRKLRKTRGDDYFGGSATATEYRDPHDQSRRFAVEIELDEHDSYVVDFPDRAPAEELYEQTVRGRADNERPYVSSDVPGVPVGGSRDHGLYRLSNGSFIDHGDLEEYIRMYGHA